MYLTKSTLNVHSAQPYDGSESVMVGSGEFLTTIDVGSIALLAKEGTLPFNDILVCLEIAKSLMPVSKLTDDYPCEFTFDSETVYHIKNDKQASQQGNQTQWTVSL